MKDITEMMQSLELYKRALECASNHLIITDLKGVIKYANKAATTMTGYALEEMIGQTPKLWGGLMPPEFYTHLWDIISTKKQVFHGEVRNHKKNGEIYYVQITISPLFDPDGEHVGYIGMEEDVTPRKILETKLRHERDRLGTVITSMGEGLIVTDPDGIVTYVNDVAQKHLDLSIKKSIGANIHEIFPLYRYKEPIKEEEHPISKITLPGQTFAVDFDAGYEVHTISGKKFPVSLKATSFYEKDHTGIVIIFDDVTREKEIDQRKTDFISLASHQLRTPLSASKWYLEMILSGDAGEITPEQQEYIHSIELSNNRMIALVNSLLNISRIESGRINIQPVVIDVPQVITGVLADFEPDIEAKKIAITKDYPSERIVLETDPKLLEHVFIALLSNAIRYSRPSGKIKIAIEGTTENVSISIIDDGLGIAPQDKERIYEKFFRGENAVKYVTDGSGLGLYLARLVVQELHGKISFVSELDHGTTFTVIFPKKGIEFRKGEVALDNTIA